ncbi:MAG: hypothetical protein GF353_25165 [Candidatus Lokiarchaeota archaeon]|nr:hypothetical protein [Candidatus Lokiarchaeota archaeon]
MNDRLKEFLKKIHDDKNKIPEYITITIKKPKKILDFKIRKEDSNILKVIAHEEDRRGWFLHSYHIPIKNLGIDEDAKNKEILPYLNDPRLITADKSTKELMEEVLRKYIEVLAERKKHYFRTKRFKVKKEFRTGTQMKGF